MKWNMLMPSTTWTVPSGFSSSLNPLLWTGGDGIAFLGALIFPTGGNVYFNIIDDDTGISLPGFPVALPTSTPLPATNISYAFMAPRGNLVISLNSPSSGGGSGGMSSLTIKDMKGEDF